MIYEPLKNTVVATSDYTPPSNALIYETNYVDGPAVEQDIQQPDPVIDYQPPTVIKIEAPYPIPLAFRNNPTPSPPTQPQQQQPSYPTQQQQQQYQLLPHSFWPISYWPQEYPNKEFINMLNKLRPSPSDW